jgi:hypothetical protein
VAKVTWGIIAICFAQNFRPAYMITPSEEKFYMLGLVAVCWATWKCRNMACFEKKIIKNPCEIFIFCLCISGGGPEIGVQVMIQR